ncbi:MAG TPA: nuclear transport factor 2 family protein [Sphingobacteriaceae bacterium]|nr:nuclear transport factor 2 family protein [Sphingobacteriaceae bacterium]
MKNLTTLTAALLMVLSFSAFAADESNNQKLNMNYALKTYMDAVTHGKISGLSEILDTDVKFTNTRGNKIINYNKSEILRSFNDNQNIAQNCSTDYRVMELNSTITIVKVVMKYEEFSKISYVSMANTTKGWKITNVSSSYL